MKSREDVERETKFDIYTYPICISSSRYITYNNSIDLTKSLERSYQVIPGNSRDIGQLFYGATYVYIPTSANRRRRRRYAEYSLERREKPQFSL